MIQLDATSNATQQSGTFSFNHTVGSGNKRLLIVCVGYYDGAGGRVCSAVSFNGVALTNAYNTGATAYGKSIWYLFNPPTGTHSIQVTTTVVAGKASAGAVSLFNVRQLAPTTNTGSGTSTTITTSITPTYSGAVIADIVSAPSGIATAGQVQLSKDIWSDGGNRFIGSSYKLANSGASSLTWTIANVAWVSACACFFPAPSGAILADII